jgi:CBS domain-containing protein
MTAGTHCRTPVRTVRLRESLRAAAERMTEERVGALVVEDAGRPVGVLTDRDIVLRVVAGDVDAPTTPVGEVVERDILTVPEDLPLGEAARRMREGGLRRIPVVDAAGHAVGMLSSDDLIRLIARELNALADVAAEQVPAASRARVRGSDEMRSVEHYAKEVATVGTDASARDAACCMRARGVGCVLVVDDAGHPHGLVTDRDLTQRVVAKGLDPAATRVSDVMSRALASVDACEPLERVAKLMSDTGVRRIPVLREGRPFGIVTFDDLVAALGRELHDLGEAARFAQERERAR